MGDLVELQRNAPRRRSAPLASPAKDRVSRSRLTFDALQQGSRVVLLCAPAGFGKTTLMRQWGAELAADNIAAAWITLDEEDRDPAALRGRLQAAQAELGLSGATSILFLDSYERIVGHPSEKDVRRLVEREGDWLRIVVSTRLKPNIGVSRLRLDQAIVEFDASQLCFTPSEIDEVFASWDIELTPEQFSAFAKVSEGWPAALQFARRSLTSKTGSVASLATGDPSAWPELRAYVSEEIFGAMSDYDQSFLMETAPLGRFTVGLASIITGEKSAEALIAKLEAHGILLRPEDGERGWRRYHPLLASCLEDRLRIEAPERLLTIHREAMLWHMERGQLSDAIRHAFAAGDQETAAELLAKASIERRRLGRVNASANWSRELPSEAFEQHPILGIQAACSFAARLELAAARTHVDSVRDRYSELDPVIRDDLLAVDAMIATYADRPLDAIEAAERGLQDCEANDPYTLGTLRLCGAIGEIAKGRIIDARRMIAEAYADNEKASSDFGMAVSHALQGLTRAIEGDLTDAVADWRKAETVIQPVATSDAVGAIAIGYLPEALYEWNDLDSANRYIEKCLASSLEVALPDMIASVFLTSVRVAYARCDRDAVRRTLEHGERTGHLHDWPRLNHAIEWERVRIAIHDKDFDRAKELHARIGSGNKFTETPGVLTHALELEANLIGDLRFEAAVTPGPNVLARLRTASAQALAQNRKWRAAKILILEAVTRQELGDESAALRCMRRALEIGAAGGLIRSFIDEGPISVRLVREIAHEEQGSPQSEYFIRLLLAIGDAPVQSTGETAAVEALSERELEVLKMLAAGLSNKQAAAKLFISENTVKWHLQHVYSKLGVRNRTGAVAVARKLGLFS